jgi:hypothetical protein
VAQPGALARPGAGLLDPARLQQDVDAHHVRPQEVDRLQDRAVDVRLGGEVDDGVHIGHQRGHDLRVRDVAHDEPQPGGLLRVRFDRREVGPVACVGQLVEDDDLGAVAAGEDVADEARADEARSAGDEQPPEAGLVRLGHEVGLGRGRRGGRSAIPARPARRRE